MIGDAEASDAMHSNHQAAEKVTHSAPGHAGPLLWVESKSNGRRHLQRVSREYGFMVTRVKDSHAALAAGANNKFAYAVVDLPLRNRDRLDLVRRLRAQHDAMRIVVITDQDSFASVVLALRAGADDFLAKPLSEIDLVDALLSRLVPLPATPETPLSANRCYWEYIQRRYEQCERNISKTAQHLSMQRRSLQRILAKRAPYPR